MKINFSGKFVFRFFLIHKNGFLKENKLNIHVQFEFVKSLLLSLIGEEGSFSHGSVIDGRFEGFIQTHGGTFYVEPAERYIKDRTLPFHSVIYHEDDISKYLILQKHINSWNYVETNEIWAVFFPKLLIRIENRFTTKISIKW